MIHLNSRFAKATAAAAVFTLSATAAAQSGSWEHEVTLYGWFPDLDGNLNVTTPGGENSISVDASDLIDAAEFAFMGAYQGRGEKWSIKADFLYLDLENSESGAVGLPGGGSLGADITAALEGTQFAVYGGYETVSGGAMLLDLMAGVRYFDMDVDASLEVDGPLPPELPGLNLGGSETFVDVVVGVQGRYSLGERWYVPYHFDIGAGDSDLTWQALVGVGYSFDWGSLRAAYRHLFYDQGNSGLVEDLEFSGPALAVSFSF